MEIINEKTRNGPAALLQNIHFRLKKKCHRTTEKCNIMTGNCLVCQNAQCITTVRLVCNNQNDKCTK